MLRLLSARIPLSAFRIVDRLLGPLAARLGFCVIDVYPERIGEIAQTLDVFVKERELGWTPRRRALVVAPQERVVNAAYLDHWQGHVRVVQQGPLMPLLSRARWSSHVVERPGTRRADGTSWDRESAHVALQAEWERQGRPPLLAVTPEDERRGAEALRLLGIPEGAWFATLHAREPGFLGETEASHRWWRNVDVRTYVPALRTVAERGGWVVRLGDPTMERLPSLPNVVDYAHHELRADWLDVYLAAAARFMIGTTSGMAVVAATFGVPLAATNWLPFSSVPRSAADLYQPKLYRRRADGRLLTFAESLGPDLFDLHDGRKLEELGLEAVDNTSREIEALTVEMLDRLDGVATYTDEDERLQRRYRALFRHFDGAAGARAGREFLRTHADLLPD
jgi:putative glycosyltransferase (TIGR04372 family)